jgi:hypothetical protein
MEGEHAVFFMCAVCFRVSLELDVCHGRSMLYCDAGCWGDECRKPPMAANGRILTRAPRWWLQHGSELANIL